MPEHIVEHSSQLNALTTVPGLRTPGRGPVRLGGTMATLEGREQWERDLNRLYFACGCDTGAAGLLLGLIAGATLAVVSMLRADRLAVSWQAFLVVVGAAIAGAVAGKLIGLLRAQRELSALIRVIQQAASPHERIQAETIACG